MSYGDDKKIFLRHHKGRSPQVSKGDREAAWRACFIGARVEQGKTVPEAEAEYEGHEGKSFTPNPRRRMLAGGVPHEPVLDVAIYTTPAGGVFVGALLESKGGKRQVELTSSVVEKMFRVSEGSALLADILRRAGRRTSLPPGFTELDAVLRRFSDDPEEFSALAEKDPGVEWVEVMPRAAVMARWGAKGERASRRL